MKLCNVEGRAAVAIDGRLVDVERASDGRLSSDPMDAVADLDALRDLELPGDAPGVDETRLGPPVPRPQKIIAVGLNYRSHAEEQGTPIPTEPVLFAKLPNALTGPHGDIAIPRGQEQVDFEVELVFVIGKRGKDISESDAWDYVAGYTVGQDVSDREEQFKGLKQFTLAKSFDTYAPIGPYLVTLDELDDREDLRLTCSVDGEMMQDSRTSDFIFGLPRMVSDASRICTLEPGDLFFTGTPSGVGVFRDPPIFLRPGTVVESEIEGIGHMVNRCVAGP
ncbi:MAG: fumarylacetoacetate hydrolase family protein [Gaiellales bacterium]